MSWSICGWTGKGGIVADTDSQVDQYLNGEGYILRRWPWLLMARWLFDKIGLPTLLILFGLGVWTGHIPSPFLTLAEKMDQRLVQTEQTMQLLYKNQEIMMRNQEAVLQALLKRASVQSPNHSRIPPHQTSKPGTQGSLDSVSGHP